MKKLYLLTTCLFFYNLFSHTEESSYPENPTSTQALAALFIGIGSKVIIDTLVRECTFKTFNVSPYQPPYALDDTQEDVAREVTEEVARTLLSTVIKRNFQHILYLFYPDLAISTMLASDAAHGMLFSPLKNLMFVTEELVSSVDLPSLAEANYETQAHYATQPLCGITFTVFPDDQREATVTHYKYLLDKKCLADLQNSLQLNHIKEVILEDTLMGIAPFMGAAFAEISFKIGQKLAVLIVQQLKKHAALPAPELLEKLIHASISVLLSEEFKIAFNTLVENVIKFSEEKEERLYLLTRLGEKSYIVAKAVAPTYYSFAQRILEL